MKLKILLILYQTMIRKYGFRFTDVNFDDFCRLLLQSNELVKNDLKWPYRQFFYLPNYNIVYNPIAKNANTSFKKIRVSLTFL